MQCHSTIDVEDNEKCEKIVKNVEIWTIENALFEFFWQKKKQKIDQSRTIGITKSNVEYFTDPLEACVQSNLITTDVWTSMGFEQEKKERLKTFERWTVDKQKINAANKDVVFMHCLPAHRGEEVSADVIDGLKSVVWQEAENRLHFQKALLEYLIKINEA